MSKPLISENLTSRLGGCVSVYVCMQICLCVHVCVSSAMVFQIFSWRKGQSKEWMRLEKGREREERRGHSRLCQFTVVAFHWDGILLGLIPYLRSHSFTLYWSFWARLFGQSFPCKLKLMLVRIQRLLSGWTGLKLSLMLRKIWEGWFWLSRRKECICILVM